MNPCMKADFQVVREKELLRNAHILDNFLYQVAIGKYEALNKEPSPPPSPPKRRRRSASKVDQTPKPKRRRTSKSHDQGCSSSPVPSSSPYYSSSPSYPSYSPAAYAMQHIQPQENFALAPYFQQAGGYPIAQSGGMVATPQPAGYFVQQPNGTLVFVSLQGQQFPVVSSSMPIKCESRSTELVPIKCESRSTELVPIKCESRSTELESSQLVEPPTQSSSEFDMFSLYQF